MNDSPLIDTLVLDTAPLLSQVSLRGLARTYVTVPQVIAELRDSKSREYFEKLSLVEGVDIKPINPDLVSFSKGT